MNIVDRRPNPKGKSHTQSKRRLIEYGLAGLLLAEIAIATVDLNGASPPPLAGDRFAAGLHRVELGRRA